MKTKGSILLGLSAALLFSVSTTSFAQSRGDVTPGVLPPGSKPFGKTYAEWAGEWLEFVYSIPFDQNPEFNFPAASVPILGQSGPVSFVAGTIEDVHVPVGQALFLQVFRVMLGTCPENPDPNFQPAPGQTIEEFLTEVAAFLTDTVTELTVEIDGVAVKNPFEYRASSGVLDDLAFGPGYEELVAPCGTGAGEHQDIVEGFWVMLAPLSKGKHTFHWAFTMGPPINFSLEGTLHLTVE